MYTTIVYPPHSFGEGKTQTDPAKLPGRCGSWGNAPVCAPTYEVHGLNGEWKLD